MTPPPAASDDESAGRSQRVLGAAGKMSGAMGIGFIINLVGNLLLARILSLDLLGVWRSVQLILQYTHFLNLGASHGLDRVGATMVTRGQFSRYRKMMGASLGFSLMLPIVGSIVILVALPWIDSPGARLGAIALVFMIPIQQFHIFSDLSLIFEKKYGTRAMATFGYTIVRIPLTLLLAWWLGLAGAMVAFVITTVGCAAYMMSRSEVRLQLSLHQGLAKSMVLTGLPITLLAFAEMVIQTVDKWMVIFLGHDTAMGLYTMAVFPLPLLLLLPSSLRDAMNVEIYDYARQKGNAEGVRALYSQTLQMIALGTPVVMGMVFFGVPWLISALLSKEMQFSIPSVELHAVVIYPILIAQTGIGVIVATRMEFKVFMVASAMALASAGITYAIYSQVRVPVNDLAGENMREQYILRLVLCVHGGMWFCYGLFILTLNHWKFGLRPAAALGRSLVYLMPMVFAGFALYGIRWAMLQTSLRPHSFVSAAVSGIVYLTVCAPGLFYLEKRYRSLSGFLVGVKRRLPGMRA